MKDMKNFLSCAILYFCHFNYVTSNSTCYRSICIPSGYNKLIKPPLYNDETHNDIEVRLYFIYILGVNENEGTITLKMNLEISWIESRIIAPNSTKEEDYIALPKEFIDHLWLPDAYIENVHKIYKYNLIHDFEEFYYGIYNNDSWITYEVDVEIIMFCKMNFESYPMDEQVCHFLLGSYSSIEKTGQWFEVLFIYFNASQQVTLLDYEFEVNILPEDVQNVTLADWGTYQRTGFEIKFRRKLGGCLMTYYIPSGILVILSWVRMILQKFSDPRK